MEVAVVDIGSSKIALVVGRLGVNNTIVVLAKAECEYSGFVDGAWLEPDKLGNTIAQTIQQAKTKNSDIKIDKLTVGIPGEFCCTVVRDEQQQLGRKRKIIDKDILDLHNQGAVNISKDVKIINIQPITYLLDNTTRTLNPEGLQASTIMARLSYTICDNKHIHHMDSVLRAIGIVEVEYCSSILAESLFLFDESRRDKGLVLVDCGYLTTSVAIIKGDGLLSHYSFSVGGGHIAADLNMYLDVPFDIALQLKQHIKLSLSVGQDDNYQVVVDNVPYRYNTLLVNAIATERINAIAKTIMDVLSTSESAQNFDIYMTGGGLSYLRGAKDIISRVVNKPVDIIAPVLQDFAKPSQSSVVGLLSIVLRAHDSTATQNVRKGLFAKFVK
ncbi:MAG: rod shape-determining protein [Clostridiales bacterium]|jgi:cell division protein FtsA|nr:rod shape-determining protein [Clostridiales bacterium]